jgi:hypothetical protein
MRAQKRKRLPILPSGFPVFSAMNKKTLKVCGIVAAVAIAAYFGVEFILGSIVTAGVNRFAPMLVHTRVRLVAARISPLTGRGTLFGLVVGNPPGWSSDKAFAMETIRIEASPSSLFGDHIVVKEILIDKPEFVYETKFVSSNIGELLKNIDSAASDGTTAQAATKGGKPIKFEVRHFRLQNGHVTVGVGSTAIRLPMPVIDLTGLGVEEGGITADQLALAVMRSVTAGVVSTTTHAARKMGSTMGAAASAKLKALFGGSH